MVDLWNGVIAARPPPSPVPFPDSPEPGTASMIQDVAADETTVGKVRAMAVRWRCPPLMRFGYWCAMDAIFNRSNQ